MNLDDSAKVAREIEERNRKKRLVITSILLCMVLMAGLGILIFFIVLKDNNTLKIYVNNVQRAIPATLFVEDNGVKYVNVNNMSSLLGVTYTRGKYQVYDEDENSCYLTSLHEVVALTAGEKTYSKFLVDEAESQLKQERMQDEIKVYGQLLTISSEQGTEEVHNLKYPIQANKNGIYVAFDDLSTMFNLRVIAENDFRIKFYSLSTLYSSALKTATKLGYPVPSYSYENMRGLIDYYFVAGESSSRVGVINTRTSSVVISCTYDRIIYLQNAKEFFIYVNDSCALFSDEGKAIIKPSEFDDISVLDQGKTTADRLYMVKKNNKYGVLNREGQIIIHPEFDYIGLKPLDFPKDSTDKSLLSELTNTKVLYDTIIPVKEGNKYGLYAIDGTELAPAQYDGLGFMYTGEIVNKVGKLANGQTGTLLIPESLGIQGIVMKRGDGYGVFDAKIGRLIIPTNCSQIYKLLKSGVTTYYMVFDNEVTDLEKYIKNNNLISVKEQPKPQVTEDTGVVYDEPVNLVSNTSTTNSTVDTNTSSNESYIQYTPTEVTNSTVQTQVPVETVPLN